MQRRRFLKSIGIVVGIIWLIGGLAPSPSSAESFPSKTITMIVPHGVGGGGDVAARILALSMQHDLGTMIIIKNITGGGNITGLSALWKSKPDGYTIGMTYAQTCASTQIFEKVIYDPKKFSIVARFVRAKYISAVPKNAPYRSIDDLKKSDRPIRVGASHVTSGGAIASYALANEVGFPVTLVSGYKGAAGAIIGALRGENDLLTYGAVLKPYLERGDLIPLIFFDFERSKEFPDVPTLKDFGLPEYLEILGGLDYVIWGPPGIPEDRLRILEKAVLKATEENRENFRKRWMFPSPLPSAETQKRVFSVYDNYVKYGGITTKGYKR